MNANEKKERLQRAGEIFLIPVGLVDSDEERNFRIDYGDIESLAESIKNSGQRHAVLVKKVNGEERYVLKDGYRRMRAIRLLIERGEDVPLIKALMVGKNYSEEDSIFEQIISNDGMPLSQVEQGRVFKVLSERGYTETQIAEKTGKKVSHVRTCIAIASLPMQMQNNVADGVLSGNTALEIYKSVGENEAIAVKVLKESVKEKKAKTGVEKVTVKPKDIATIKSLSPMKLLKETLTVLINDSVKGQKVKLLENLIEKIENKCDPVEIAELFK